MQGEASELAAALREMAAPTKKDVWLMGGGRVLARFVDAGEVDVLDLFVMPVLLGRGLPLFPERDGARVPLSLRSSETLASGVVRATYERA
jgi:dihydrofolate reductase